jgi:hypothetical protein
LGKSQDGGQDRGRSVLLSSTNTLHYKAPQKFIRPSDEGLFTSREIHFLSLAQEAYSDQI